jgi:hypothetical protein
MDWIAATNAPHGDKDLIMMGVIRHARKGQPGCFLLIAKLSANDLKSRFIAVVRLGKVGEKVRPMGFVNMACHHLFLPMGLPLHPLTMPVHPYTVRVLCTRPPSSPTSPGVQ